MKIILSAVEDELAEAWRRFCGDFEFVEVRRGSIFDLSCDAVVSPANSFGFMDGGIDMIDMLYSQRFGWQFPKSWADAQSRHQRPYADRVRDLQHE